MRPWLILSRLSNLPTVWTNVLAGMVLGGGVADLDGRLLAAAIGVSLMYIGGMVLNDVCDAEHDRAHRSNRPIPTGRIDRRRAGVVATVQMLLGVVVVWWWAPRVEPLLWALALVGAITYYDVRHKRDPAAPLVMGICRGLVYVVAASMVGVVTSTALLVGAGVMTAWVAGFTLAARRVPAVRPWVSWCIAAISLVDAAALLAVGAPMAAGVATLGLPLTLALQRWIPGD